MIICMEIIKVDKNNRTPNLIDRLLTVWESSVKDSHSFLSLSEIENIKQYVPQALENVAILITDVNDNNNPVAFMGIENNKLEMLFVRADKRGKGLGTKLIQLGIKEYSINDLRVNEQNPSAKKFYENNGFRIYNRTELDEQGNPYPLLFMKL